MESRRECASEYVQNHAEKLITPQRFWSEKTVTIMKFIALGLAAILVTLAGCSKSPEVDAEFGPFPYW